MAGNSGGSRAEDNRRRTGVTEGGRCLAYRQRGAAGGAIEIAIAAVAEANRVGRAGHFQGSGREAGQEIVVAIERGVLADAVKCDLYCLSGRHLLRARVGVEMT